MPYLGLDTSAPKMSVMAHRSRGSRSERVVSGQDLPEVVPWQDAPHRKPSERQSHVIPQVLAVDTTPFGDKLESRFSRFSLASTHFQPPESPAAVSRKSSFKPSKKKHWIVLVAVIVIIAAAIAIAAGVAVTLANQKHKPVNPGKGSNGGAAPDGANAQATTVVVSTTSAPTGTAQPSAASAVPPASTASSCPNYVGPGISEVPQSLPGQVSSQPPNTVHVNVQFASKMPYTLVSNDQGQQQQIQSLVPQAFAFALSIDASQIQMGATIPNDTAAELCYIQTVAQVYAPQQYKNTLELYAFNWSSPLFHSPQYDVYTLMSRIQNMTFPS